MLYVMNKTTNKIICECDTIYEADLFLNTKGIEKEDCRYLQEVNEMKYISRVTYVDGKCVYNSKDYWKHNLYETDIETNYSAHSVKDILGNDVDENRFNQERVNNYNRLAVIDGRPGQIDYNMEVGKEFVSLFREECILTKFTKESNTSPMIIFEKLTPVIAMLDAGAFREAKQYLAGYREKIKDDFLTDERIDKYIAMLDAADAIEYATDEDYFYVVPGEEDAN